MNCCRGGRSAVRHDEDLWPTKLLVMEYFDEELQGWWRWVTLTTRKGMN